MNEKLGPKKVFIIEAKLSPEELKNINEMLNSKPKEYKRVYACAIADYIITELKSPSRIMRNVKKSTCPVVHVSWLYESLKSDKVLDSKDYCIDVSDERKKLNLESISYFDPNKLPLQVTWNQVVKGRLEKSSQNDSSEMQIDSGLKERVKYMEIFRSRYKSKSSSSINFESGQLEKKSVFDTSVTEKRYSTQPMQPHTSCSTKNTTALHSFGNKTCCLPVENISTDVMNNNSEQPMYTSHIPIHGNDSSSFHQPLSLSTKEDNDVHLLDSKGIISISDSEDDELHSNTKAQDEEVAFSISSTNNNHLSIVKENLSCSAEKVSRSLNASSFDEALPSSLHHSCSYSFSSVDADSEKYSLSKIVS